MVEHSEEVLEQEDLLWVDRLSEGRQAEDQLLLECETETDSHDKGFIAYLEVV